MSVSKLTRIALLGCIQFVVFSSFSDVLYLEMITLVTVIFALVFEKDEAVLASVVYVLLNMILKQGVTLWSMIYCGIYPSYSLIVSCSKKWLIRHKFIVAILCGLLSFMTGQIMQLPFIIFSKNLTLLYIILGLKTSFFQGCLSGFSCVLLYEPMIKVLSKIRRSYEHEKFNKISS